MAVNAQQYFLANPDVAQSFASNNYGMTPQAFADFHYQNYGQYEQRNLAPIIQPQYDVVGDGESQQIFVRGEPQEQAQQVQQQTNPALTGENLNKLAAQILAQNTTSKWSGGLPPETSAMYMAHDLAKSGITDISQVGKGPDGIINKATGEKLVSGYGERTKGNLWSGSYEGKGNTGFGVEFDDKGNPIFFTQGASSSTLKKDLLKLAVVGGAIYGLGGFEGLFGGAGTAAGAAGTAGETAFDLANAGIAGGTASFTPAQLAAIQAGASAAEVAAAGAGSGLLTKAATDATAFELQNAGASALTDLSATNQAGLLTGTKTAAELAAEKLAAEELAKKTAITTIGGKTSAELAAEELAKKTIADELKKKVGDTASGLFQTAGSLLQSKESKEAARQAATDIGTATQNAVAGSQFRPVGMTSRFGTSQYKYDPVTGQMISAGYQLSPEAKAQQDRFATMANYSLTQAENAQSQFNPLQTGAANLFTLGNKYIEKTPESVAQTYIDQQMALLKPSREVELANLQNRLQQQGRLGLSVAQGGSMGATTPELQALYNARAQQEAQLAANAQQAGQQSVLFGAGLLGQGTNALNQYYGGQVAAYQPYQAAMGQVQNLESLGQQPLQMGATLGQQSSAAGARAGQLGIQGQQLSSAYNTSANATYDPFAGLLTAAGNPSSMFGQVAANAFAPGGAISGALDRYLYPSGNPLQTGALANPGLWT